MDSDKDLMELLEQIEKIMRPLAECCGKIPQGVWLERTYCVYCEMSAEWCQCDVSDFCDC
jgi:hypothetical protein